MNDRTPTEQQAHTPGPWHLARRWQTDESYAACIWAATGTRPIPCEGMSDEESSIFIHQKVIATTIAEVLTTYEDAVLVQEAPTMFLALKNLVTVIGEGFLDGLLDPAAWPQLAAANTDGIDAITRAGGVFLKSRARVYDDADRNPTEDASNANLIAAAPQMLAALVAAWPLLIYQMVKAREAGDVELHRRACDSVNAIDAAIAASRGGAL